MLVDPDIDHTSHLALETHPNTSVQVAKRIQRIFHLLFITTLLNDSCRGTWRRLSVPLWIREDSDAKVNPNRMRPPPFIFQTWSFQESN